jgi:hypothetical protein
LRLARFSASRANGQMQVGAPTLTPWPAPEPAFYGRNAALGQQQLRHRELVHRPVRDTSARRGSFAQKINVSQGVVKIVRRELQDVFERKIQDVDRKQREREAGRKDTYEDCL